MTETWSITKSEVRSTGGLVACQNWRAAEAGAAVLARGGNAMDAAVTTALVLSVVEPWLSGVGGGGFLLAADGATGRIDALDFNMQAGRTLDPRDYPLAGGRGGDWFDWPAVAGDRNLHGPGAICVPGAIAGLSAALDRFGTIGFDAALAPAIEHAHAGLEVDWYAALAISIDADILSRDAAASALFLQDGRAPRPGDGAPRRLPMPRKAAMLERLAKAGARDFYEGETAASLLRDLKAHGAPLGAADLRDYSAAWHRPLTVDLRGTQVHAMPALSGGPTLVAALAALHDRLPDAGPDEPATVLALARALRRATEARLRGMGHAAGDGCTTHVSVVDGMGNMVALTNTLLSRFGAKVVLPETQILMNNGVMWFDPRPGQPNSIAPTVRPLANMSPAIASRGGLPWLAVGAAGGRMIVPAVAQILTQTAVHGRTLEAAFHAPRIDTSTPVVRINARASAAVEAALAAEFPVARAADTVYPTSFAVPSAVMRADGLNSAMAYPFSPWAGIGQAKGPTS